MKIIVSTCAIVAVLSGLAWAEDQVKLDKALCADYGAKLVNNWEDVFRCKVYLADYCNGVMKEELHAQHKLHDEYLAKLNDYAHKIELPNHKEVEALIQEVSKFIHYHQTTIVDICGFNEKCVTCTHDYMNQWYKTNYTCTSPNAWKIVQYYPSK